MAAAARTGMYSKSRDWPSFLRGVNSFVDQAKADMRTRGVQAMLCTV
jgi:hypothetical protein